MIGAFGGFFVYAEYRGISDELSVKWRNVFLTALFVFGYAIEKFWKCRQKWSFWAELSVLVVAHFVILQRLQWQKANYFWLIIVVGLPEMFVVFFLLGLMFVPNSSEKSKDLTY